MIRTLVTPLQQNISINIPKQFIGTQVEVIAFTIEESVIENNIEVDTIFTHIASQHSLSKDWLTPQEDAVWKNL